MRQPDPRIPAMAVLYKSGLTLQAIGDQYSISRERVRQLLRGVVTADQAKKARPKAADRNAVAISERQKFEPGFVAKYGISGSKK